MLDHQILSLSLHVVTVSKRNPEPNRDHHILIIIHQAFSSVFSHFSLSVTRFWTITSKAVRWILFIIWLHIHCEYKIDISPGSLFEPKFPSLKLLLTVWDWTETVSRSLRPVQGDSEFMLSPSQVSHAKFQVSTESSNIDTNGHVF